MRIKHAFLVLTLLGAACAHRSAPANPSAEAQTTLKVENDGVVDMDVFVRSEGQLMRLGFVPGGHTETFPLPASIVPGARQLRFEMRPIGGGRSSRSETIVVSPGEQVQLIIPPR